MKKFTLKNNNYKNILTIITLAFYLSFIMNFDSINSYPLNVYIRNCLNIFVVVSLVLTIFSIHKILFIIFSSFLIVSSSATLFYSYFYNVKMDINIIMAVFGTDTNEALELLSPAFIIFMVIFAILPIIILIFIKFKKFNFKLLAKVALVIISINVILIIISNILAPNTAIVKKKGLSNYILKFIPLDMRLSPLNYIYYAGKYASLQKGDFNHKDLITNNKYNFANNKEPLTVILVIGETARAANFSLNGYKRNTNPLLSKEKNLVFFTNVQSCYTGTIFSVSCLLSNINGKDFRSNIQYYLKNEVNSFIPIFNHLGFNSSFISNNSTKPGDPMFQRFKDAKNIYFPSALTYSEKSTDMIILSYIDNIFNNSKIDHKNKLIILHTIGSHFKYSSRYENSVAKFYPACTTTKNNLGDCDKQEIINDYDNTILQTDKFLHEVIERVRNKNAIVLYTSDHGENLGENAGKIADNPGRRKFFHGSDWALAPKVETHVPLILWFSNKYLKTYGQQNLTNARQKTKVAINHDVIFHSILDCANINSTSKVIDKNLSICSNQNITVGNEFSKKQK